MERKAKPKKPTAWCTRADKYYYDHYSSGSPLYVIRNWKTGKAYQLAFMDSSVEFLVQDDVKGDEITDGDLSSIPDELLKLIKDPHGGRTLLDFKKAPEENSKTKRGYITKPMSEINTVQLGKPRDIGNGVIAQDVLNYSESPNNSDKLSAFFKMDGHVYKNNTTAKFYSHKDKATKYYPEGQPDVCAIYTGSSKSGIGGCIITSKGWHEIERSDDRSLLDKVENQAAKDFGFAKNRERAEKYDAKYTKNSKDYETLQRFNEEHEKELNEIFYHYKDKLGLKNIRKFVGINRIRGSQISNKVYQNESGRQITDTSRSPGIFNLEAVPCQLIFINNKGVKVCLYFIDNKGMSVPYHRATAAEWNNTETGDSEKITPEEFKAAKAMAHEIFKIMVKMPEYKNLARQHAEIGGRIYESYFNY